MTGPDTTRRFWIAVASAEHARRGREGFMQVNHGKAGPLRRIGAGNGVVYYAPSEKMRVPDGLQSFVLIGTVVDGEIYQVEQAPGFAPHRLRVSYAAARETPIRSLLDRLELTRAKRNWGAPFRYGLVEISRADFACIAETMQARIALV